MTTTDRLPNESAPAFEAFTTYCRMGGQRTTRAVARKLRKSVALIQRWSRKNGWKARTALWDDQQVHAQQTATEKAELELAREKARRRDKVQERAWEIAEKLIQKAQDMLQFPVGRQERTESEDGKTVTMIAHPARWTFADVGRLATAADTLARLSCGMATGKQEITGEGGAPLVAAQPTALIIKVTHGDETDRARAAFGPRPGNGT